MLHSLLIPAKESRSWRRQQHLQQHHQHLQQQHHQQQHQHLQQQPFTPARPTASSKHVHAKFHSSQSTQPSFFDSQASATFAQRFYHPKSSHSSNNAAATTKYVTEDGDENFSFGHQGMWATRMSNEEQIIRKESELMRGRADPDFGPFVDHQVSDSDGAIYIPPMSQKRYSANMSTFQRNEGDTLSQNQNVTRVKKSVVGSESPGIWTTRLSGPEHGSDVTKKSRSGNDFRVLQKLLQPAMTIGIHRHILESDDHAFNSDECDLVSISPLSLFLAYCVRNLGCF